MSKAKETQKDNITIQPGETVALCRCWKSKTFPKCDGSHRALTTSEGPIVVTGASGD